MDDKLLQLGVLVPVTGTNGRVQEFGAWGRQAEEAGADVLWVSDHIALPESMALSRYPFSALPRWSAADDWLESMTSSAYLLATTERVNVGISVLILPQRDPLTVAKVAATLSVLGDGRFLLGVGAGWWREELEAFGVEFERRGRLMEEGIELIREAFEGHVTTRGGTFRVPHPLAMKPTPVPPAGFDRMPILIGGMSKRALRRAATIGDGWIAAADPASGDPTAISSALDHLSPQERRAGYLSVRIMATDLDLHRDFIEALPLDEFDELAFCPDFSDPDAAIDAIGRARRFVDGRS